MILRRPVPLILSIVSLARFFVLAAPLALLTACVSVSLEGKKSKRSEGVQFEAPRAPFKKLSTSTVDVAWKNSRTGSIISFLSECSIERDLRLEALRAEVIQGLSDEKILIEDHSMYAGRAALRSSVIGSVDGVESAVDLLVFKKDGCSYVLSLVSTPNLIQQDRVVFDQFLTGFQTP